MNEQVSNDKPRDRWLWLAGILIVVFFVLLWGFQTAIQMEEGMSGDSDAATTE